MTALEKNAVSLEKEIAWFISILNNRIKAYFEAEKYPGLEMLVAPPDLYNDDSNYSNLVTHYNMNVYERAILVLALIPHVKPHLLDIFFSRNENYHKEFTEFGGYKGTLHAGFLPTAETAAFILTGKDLKQRFSIQHIFEENHFLRRHQILVMDSPDERDALFSRPIRITKEFLSYLTTGHAFRPDFSASFPASRLQTQMTWDDLVLEADVREEVEEINQWIRYGKELLNTGDLSKKLKKGFRALFYGPPGTGKTLTATLLGKANNLDVYRIDLSMVVSKYIGETEKNLANVFDRAENKNWILFFDEADALFGKRTSAKDSKDRYANQEISYLLQRIEDFPGLIILATNLKANMDEAFARRFQSMIYFPVPTSQMRYDLWKNAFGNEFQLDDSINLQEISRIYELSGGAITNVLRFCGLQAFSRGSRLVNREDLLGGIRKEMLKEGKTVK